MDYRTLIACLPALDIILPQSWSYRMSEDGIRFSCNTLEDRAISGGKIVMIYSDLRFECVLGNLLLDSLEHFGVEKLASVDFVAQIIFFMETQSSLASLTMISSRIDQLFNLAEEYFGDRTESSARLPQLRFIREQAKLIFETSGKSRGKAFKYSNSLLKVLMVDWLIG